MTDDPVVEELAAVMLESWEPGRGWHEIAKAVLADAGLRERIGAWEPPPDVAEMAAEALRSAFIDEWGGCNGGAPGAILMALRTMTTNGWTLTPPSEGAPGSPHPNGGTWPSTTPPSEGGQS